MQVNWKRTAFLCALGFAFFREVPAPNMGSGVQFFNNFSGSYDDKSIAIDVLEAESAVA